MIGSKMGAQQGFTFGHFFQTSISLISMLAPLCNAMRFCDPFCRCRLFHQLQVKGRRHHPDCLWPRRHRDSVYNNGHLTLSETFVHSFGCTIAPWSSTGSTLKLPWKMPDCQGLVEKLKADSRHGVEQISFGLCKPVSKQEEHPKIPQSYNLHFLHSWISGPPLTSHG